MNKNYQSKGMRFGEFKVGDVSYTGSRTITEADIANFAGWTWDTNPLHTDEEFAKQTIAGGRVAHGALTLAYSLGLVDNTGVLDGTAVASLNYSFKMVGFVKPGDTICVKSTVVGTKLTSKGDRGVVSSRLETLNQLGEVVAITDTAVMFIA